MFWKQIYGYGVLIYISTQYFCNGSERGQKRGSTDLHNRVFWTSINASKRLTFCHFSNQQFRQETTKSLQRFFHLASARYVSLEHDAAINTLIDWVPESSIHCWASAVLHSTGAFFFWEMLPTAINLLGSCNFLSSPH